jgi:hypothetical protein
VTFNHSNPLFLAEKAQQMAKGANGRESEVFQKVALISMCTVAVASGMQVLLHLWRELNRQEKGHSR